MAERAEHAFLDPNIPRKGAILNERLETAYENHTEPPFFSLIEFNLSGLCNRNCVFCPRGDPTIYPNVNEHLPIELYEKVTKELEEIDYEGMILFSAFSEPLLYKQLEAIIEMSKRYCPKVRIESVTDGDFVTPAKLNSLFDAGLDSLLISMYDGPEQLKKFQAMRDAVGLNEEQVILRKRWLPPEEHYGITLSNRAGMIEIPETGVGMLNEPLTRPCFYPFYQVLIDYDGAVLLCPHDWGKKLIVGNVKNDSLVNLWNSRTIRRVRLNLAKSDRNFPPCRDCDVDGTLMGRRHYDEWMTFYGR